MAKAANFDCDFSTGPVTVVHTVRDQIVLAGIGSYLHTFDISEQKTTNRVLTLPCHNIHGIREANGSQKVPLTLAVFGEKCITVLDLHQPENNTQKDADDGNPGNHGDSVSSVTTKAEMREFQDWIWDAIFLDHDENGDLTLALGHNTVIRWDWKQDQIVELVTCVENCILYCAKLINSRWDNLLVAAGTVFNEILLWAPRGQRSTYGHVTVMKSLKGHKGVIFSVDYLNQKQIMCSASDDRSIRLWQCTFQISSTSCGTEIPLEFWEGCTCACVHVLYGHSARVWDVKLLTTTLVSVGEDSTCCVWDYEGAVLQKFKGHKGKSIWSLSVDDKEKFVVTGGGDGSVRLWYLSSRSERSNYITQSLQLPQTPSGKEDDYPRSVSLLNYDEIVVITNEGCLFLFEVEKNQWKTLQTDPEFRSYTVMTVAPTRYRCVALGNIHGKLRIFMSEGPQLSWSSKDWQIYNGKTMSVHWLSASQLLTSGPEGEIKVWNFEVVSLSLECCGRYILPACKQRWVSAAAIGHSSLICGDRSGTVHVYQLTSEGNPSQSFPKIHGKTGVTSISFYGDSVYTTGRDGCYRVFSHDDGYLTLLNTYRVYKGLEWVDRLEVAEEETDFLIFGFQSSDFVLWSVNSNQRLLQIPCGGGHRSWDCKTKGDNFRFVYQKTREVVLCNTILQQNQVKLKSALHGRETTCVKYLDVRNDGCVVVTGSEDTSIQISALKYNEFGVTEMSCMENLNGHISSVRALSLSPSSKQSHDQKSTLMFSAGGRAQLLVWRLTVGKHASLVCENLCSYMIGQRKRRGRTRMWKLQQIKLNPETRFMDLSSVQLSSVWPDFPPHLHLLASACSDAFVRFYILDEEKRELFNFMESVFHEHCVLKVCCVKRKHDTDCNLYVLSAATDGCIAFWKTSKGKISLAIQNHSELNTEKTDVDKTSPSMELHTSQKNVDLQNHCDNAECVISTSSGTESEERTYSELEFSQLGDKTGVSKEIDHGHDVSREVLEIDSVEKLDMEGTKPIFSLKHHQSGVNGLDWLHFKADDFLIASGGDDNALVISLVEINGDDISVKANGSCTSAHATEITGVRFVSHSKLLSVSIDQRMILWNIGITEGDIQLEQLACKLVCVADISNMDIWKLSDDKLSVVIAGEGLATFEVQYQEPQDQFVIDK